MKVEISEEGLGDHFVTMSTCIQAVIKKVVPTKKRIVFDA